MNRLTFFCLAAFAATLFGCNQQNQVQHASVVAADIAIASGKKPRNILWIYIEDQNNWTSVYGDNTVATPTMQSFADAGVVFERTMMPAAVCSATRSALITGVYQTTNGVHNHRSSRSKIAPIFLPQGFKTVPELFQDAGYATFNIGKDDYNFNYDRAAMYNAHKPKAGWQGAFDGSKFDWAKELKDKPFFGQIQLKGGKHNSSSMKKFKIPHVDRGSVTLPPYYPDTADFRERWAQHYETQVASDQELKGILKQLEDYGLLEDTAVFFFSDHGMILARHKQYLYEAGVHVPFILSWPAGNDELRKLGARRGELVNGLDISATSLAISGIPVPDYYDGKNLFDAGFDGHPYVISAKDRMDYTFDRSRTVRTERFRYMRNFNPERPHLQAGYRDSHQYMIDLRTMAAQGKLTPAQEYFTRPVKDVEELYDMQNDPHQIHNLSDDPAYADELKRHRQILLEWIAETDDKGAYPESDAAVREVIMMWGKACDSPECQSYRRRYADKLDLSAEQVHPVIAWPDYMKKPIDPLYDKVENIYRPAMQ